MVFTTRLRFFRFRLLGFLVISGEMASSCQSSRPSFSFQPAPHHERAAQMPPVEAAADSTVAAVGLPALATPPLPRLAAESVREKRRPTTPQSSKQPVATSLTTVVLSPASAAVHRREWLRRPHATAEVGLGTTVLGVLGLIALPIALIGLVVSGGGLVWAVVAGLAAVAVLVAYLDPFGRQE
ncbi:hypothetical protein I2I05_17540 [Hymenobacter sp. BT683]|uniref:Uncharacterized protein n=1 Tax=Hymenobacter jeongseonensis TaxID=2791027 RepID=A0ABS0ILI1_9BACT|nr:hypothetical protein [Hymenobacter jeongseonensis]MBF9239211.1 hypothetical protein [Hymenobacter jeongseonensis]